MLVSMLLPDLRGGGAERVGLVLAKEMKTLGCEVEFVVMSREGELADQVAEEFSIDELGAHRMRHVPRLLARYLQKRSPDVLIASMWPLTNLAAFARVISGWHGKVLVSEHAMLSAQYAPKGKLHRLMMRLVMAIGYRMADYLVGVSEGVARDVERLAFLKAGRFEVVSNPVVPVRTCSHDEVEAASELWGSGTGGRLLSVGRFKAVKNHALLLRSFERVTQDRDASLLLLGNGELEQALRELAGRLGIGHRVIFGGFQPDPTPFYCAADLLVLSSDNEGFGNVIVEAMATGTPVVSTDCPSGPAEILDGGRYGRLVPVGDVDALADAILSTLRRPQFSEADLKARAKEYDPKRVAARYLSILHTRCAERK